MQTSYDLTVQIFSRKTVELLFPRQACKSDDLWVLQLVKVVFRREEPRVF